MSKTKKNPSRLLKIAVCISLIATPLSPFLSKQTAKAAESNNEFTYTGNIQNFIAPYEGTYDVKANGAQGIKGGLGGSIHGQVDLKKGEKLEMTVGGQQAKFGGGAGENNGGDPTIIKMNENVLLIGAGGGGGTGATAGGMGTSLGGASVGSTSGSSGKNGGGGGSSFPYTSYYTSPGYWKEGVNYVVDKCWVNDKGQESCTTHPEPYKYWVEGTTHSSTTPGLPGQGGANFASTKVKNVESLNSVQSGTGTAKVTPVNYFPVLSIASKDMTIEYGKDLEIKGSILDPDAQAATNLELYQSIDNGEKKHLVKVTSSTTDKDFTASISNLSIGNHTLRIWGEDSKGGISNTIDLNIEVKDNIPPTIAIDNLQDGDLVIDKITPDFNITDHSKPIEIKVLLDGEKYEEGTPITESGKHKLSIEATDAVGNTATKEISFAINKKPQVIKRIESQTTQKYNEVQLNLNDYFKDVESDSLKFFAESDNEKSVGVSVEGSKLKLHGVKQGTANLTVKANDGHSDSEEITFAAGVNTRPPVLSYTINDLVLIDDTKDFELQGTVLDKDIEDVTVKGTLNGIEQTMVVPTTGQKDKWSLKWKSDLSPGIYNDLSVRADDGYGGTQELAYPYLIVKVQGSAAAYEKVLNRYVQDLSISTNDMKASEHESLLDAYYAMKKLAEATTPDNIKDAKRKVSFLVDGNVKQTYLATISQKAWEYTTQHLDTVDVEVLTIAGIESTNPANEALYQQKGQLYKQDTISHTITDQFTKTDMQYVIDSVNTLKEAEHDETLAKWLLVKEKAFEGVIGEYQKELLDAVLKNALQIVQQDTSQLSLDSLKDFFHIDGQEKYINEYQEYLKDVIQSLKNDLTTNDIETTVKLVDALNNNLNEGLKTPSKNAITDYIGALSELVKGNYQEDKEKDLDQLKLAYLVTYPEKHDKEDFKRLHLAITEDNIQSYYPKLTGYIAEMGSGSFTVHDAQKVLIAVDASILAISAPTDKNIKFMNASIEELQNGDKLFSDYIKQLQDVIWEIAQNTPEDLTASQLEQLLGSATVPENLDEYKENLKQYTDDKGKTLSKEEITLVIEATNAVVKAEKGKTMILVDEAKAIVDKLEEGQLKSNLLNSLEQVVLSIITANSEDVTDNLLEYLGIQNVVPAYMDEYQKDLSDYGITAKQDVQSVVDTVNDLMVTIHDWTVVNIASLEKTKDELNESTFKTTTTKYVNVLQSYRLTMNRYDEKALNIATSTISSLPDSLYKEALAPSETSLQKLVTAKTDLNKATKDEAQLAIGKMAKSLVKEELRLKWQELQLEYLNTHLDEMSISALKDLDIKNLNPEYEQDYVKTLKQYAEDKGAALTKEDIQLVIDVINAYNKANTVKDNGSVREAQDLIKTLIDGKLKEALSKDMAALYNVLNPYIPTKDDWLNYVQKNPAIVTENDLTRADIKNVNSKYADDYRLGLENYTKDKGSVLSKEEIQQIIDMINSMKVALEDKKASSIQKLEDAIESLSDGKLKDDYRIQLQSLKSSIGVITPVNVISIQKTSTVDLNVELSRKDLANSSSMNMKVTVAATKTMKDPILTVVAEKGKKKTVLKTIKIGKITSGKEKKLNYTIKLNPGNDYKVTAYLTDGKNNIEAENTIDAKELKNYLFLEKVSNDMSK
ncbi:hypothetical protein [Rummeliibacillus stabekisii]|uniref:hypothetical protein n=1 Tax=Rummeliibacillus stabekisii TaxID=241244 RepID=UPI00371CE53B